ncbi:hypothetical protein D3875_04450 [Deinococcus cavernae]|uniref:ASCH domain-containing protein n=1 Tax=Deinococcus cavernae TaxID=2320857 RepID=A0A418VEJ8_9DEIO|nr:hypothetical protein [Deinococcus cavernae]RJF74536.1 hypothetical protein D3875_04450 [Deinococcus cavernae]
MAPPIKGLTLLHPWAFAVQKLNKDVENRSQHITRKGGCVGMYLAIHGGVPPKPGYNARWADFQQQTRGLIHVLENGGGTKGTLRASGALVEEGGQFTLSHQQLIVPGIVAVARVSACVKDHPSPWSVAGEWQYVLSDVLVLGQPLEQRGGQGLWEIPEPNLTRLIQAWEAAHCGACPFRPKGWAPAEVGA